MFLAGSHTNLIKRLSFTAGMDPSRPLDALNNNRDKTVTVELKNGRVFKGTLKSFDIHINTVLFKAVEIGTDGSVVNELGTVFVRGDAVLMINPEE